MVSLVALFREIARNSCGTAEQLLIGSPRLNIIGKEVALITIKIFLTLFAIGQCALGDKVLKDKFHLIIADCVAFFSQVFDDLVPAKFMSDPLE